MSFTFDMQVIGYVTPPKGVKTHRLGTVDLGINELLLIKPEPREEPCAGAMARQLTGPAGLGI